MAESEPSSEQLAREARIAELEERLAKRRPVGVRAPVAALCIVGALILAWLDRHDIAYFFSSRTPITLGSEGEYQLSAIAPNRYVQLRGAPTLRAYYENKNAMVLVGFKDSPFIIRRRTLPGEEFGPHGKPPPPNQTPFAVRGRLMTREMARAWDVAFADFLKWGELQPHDGQLYLVVEGDRPGSDVGLTVVMGLLAAFVVLNGYFLGRDLRARRKVG